MDKKYILDLYIDRNGEKLGDKVLSEYEKYSDDVESDEKTRKDLEIEIECMLLDMKVVITDDKTRMLLGKINDGIYESVDTSDDE